MGRQAPGHADRRLIVVDFDYVVVAPVGVGLHTRQNRDEVRVPVGELLLCRVSCLEDLDVPSLRQVRYDSPTVAHEPGGAVQYLPLDNAPFVASGVVHDMDDPMAPERGTSGHEMGPAHKREDALELTPLSLSAAA